MKKREATKAKNRSLLLEAGRKVFATRGFTRARITDITDEAGLAAGTFYKYFQDKRELFTVIVEDLTPTFRKTLRNSRRFDLSEPPEAWVRRGFGAFLDIAEAYPELVRLFLVQDSSLDPDFTESLSEVRHRYQDDLVADLRQWASAGAIPPMEAELVSQLVISMAVTMAVIFLSDPERLREPILNAMTNMVVGGIKENMIHTWGDSRDSAKPGPAAKEAGVGRAER